VKYSNILFDLDGTLTDPKLGITKSVQYALQKYNIQEDDTKKLESFIGPPLHKSFMEHYSFTKSEAEKAVGYYREYFAERGMYENELYEGISQLLEMLVNQKRTLIVATSKPTVYAELILDHFNLHQYFEDVVGSNIDGTRSDKSEIIKYILKGKQLDKNLTVMIGDRKFDILGAHSNGIASIGVGYGYGSEAELTESKPTYFAKTVGELVFKFS